MKEIYTQPVYIEAQSEQAIAESKLIEKLQKIPLPCFPKKKTKLHIGFV